MGAGSPQRLRAIRDYRVANSTHVIEFASGLLPVLADGAAAFLVVGLGVLVMRAIAGPVDRDELNTENTENTERGSRGMR